MRRGSLFVAGTDTGVGKTVIAAALCQAVGASYWKPIQSGSQATDASTVSAWIGGPRVMPEAYLLEQPLSPHLAAEKEGIDICLSAIEPPELGHSCIVEGAGGVLTPITRSHSFVDLMAQLSLPVLVVVNDVLGAINHTLLTLEALRRRHITVVGVVLNGRGGVGNAESIETIGKTPILGRVGSYEIIDRESLQSIGESLDIVSLQNALDGFAL